MTDHLCGVFPQGVEVGEIPGAGLTAVAHIAGRIWEHFIYQHFLSQVWVVQRGGGGSAPLLLVRNTRAIGVAHQTSEDSDMRKEHSDAVAETLCGDCELIHGGKL